MDTPSPQALCPYQRMKENADGKLGRSKARGRQFSPGQLGWAKSHVNTWPCSHRLPLPLRCWDQGCGVTQATRHTWLYSCFDLWRFELCPKEEWIPLSTASLSLSLLWCHMYLSCPPSFGPLWPQDLILNVMGSRSRKEPSWPSTAAVGSCVIIYKSSRVGGGILVMVWRLQMWMESDWKSRFIPSIALH